MFSLDAKTGKLDPNFGDGGIRDLRKELDPKVAGRSLRTDVGPGDLERHDHRRAFRATKGPRSPRRGHPRVRRPHRQARSGGSTPCPVPGEFGHETWEGDSWKDRGGANAWGGFSVDVDRGLVFAGLGSATFDFYGGDRHGDNLFANCTIALDARTGQRVWHFQTLRHDLWDHDLPVYPNLVTVTARRQSESTPSRR